MTIESPEATVRGAASRPYQSMLPAFAVVPEIVSQIWMPETDAAEANVPNVMATVLNTGLPAAAAEPKTVAAGDCRVQPDPVHSLPEVEVGDPRERPIPHVVGRVAVWPVRIQSSISFCEKALMFAMFLLL